VSDADLWAAWRLWMVVAGMIVLVAAALLVVIWTTARGIRQEALRALAAVEAIQKNTQSIWALQATNDVAAHMADTVEAIQQKGSALVEALAGRMVGRHAK
jgi:hypothetical protein